MKNSIVIICLILLVFSCKNNGVEKPKNLIEKETMIDVLYDMSLLEAIKSHGIGESISNKNVNDYIFKKYKIDSVQFSESNKYYASDIDEYKKMFEKVKSRLDKEIKKLEKENKSERGNKNKVPVPNDDTPQVQ